MNFVNRVIVVLLLLAALIAVTAFCLFPEYFIQQISDFAEWIVPRTLPELPLIDHLYLIGAAAVIDIGLLLILALELYRPRRKTVKVQNVDGGSAVVTVESIRQRLAFYIDGLEHVVSCKPTVTVKGDAVSVSVEVEASAAVSVPAKAREIISIVDMVVKETLGLKLRGIPSVNIRTGSYKNLSRNEAAYLTASGRSQPATPSPVPVAPTTETKQEPAPDQTPKPAAYPTFEPVASLENIRPLIEEEE